MSGKKLMLAGFLAMLLGVTGLMPMIGLVMASPSILVVDDDGLASASNCDDTSNVAYLTISAALAAANPGDTIFVCPGTYDEQVTVTKNGITIEGSGIGSTVVKPTSLPQSSTSLFSGAGLKYIILVDGVSDVTIKKLTVDGSDAADKLSGCSPGYIGIFYRASSGLIENVEVTHLKLPSTLLGCQIQLGIFVQSGYGPHLKSNVEVKNSKVTDYGKNGITCNEAGTKCFITGNEVAGIGPTDVIGQNGIQLGFGATGSVRENVVKANFYTPETYTACGILIFRAGGTVSGNTFGTGPDANEVNVCNSGGQNVPQHPAAP